MTGLLVMGMVLLRLRCRRDDRTTSDKRNIHTIREQLSKGRILIRLQATGENTLAGPTRLRHQRAPEIANDHLPPVCSQRLPDGLPSFSIRSRALGAPTTVNTPIGACLLGELILVHGRGGDNDDARVVGAKEGVGEDGEEVLAIGLQRDVLVADAAEVAGVVGAEEEGLVTG